MSELFDKYMEKCNKEFVENTWFVAALTDEFIVDSLANLKTNLSGKEEKILEIRVFNNAKEYKLTRSNIDKGFIEREISDSDSTENFKDYFDEIQYLDIDTAASINNSGTIVTSTGGGKYNLPLNNINNAKVRIRYYLNSYKKTGQARVADWRIVELMEGK